MLFPTQVVDDSDVVFKDVNPTYTMDYKQALPLPKEDKQAGVV